MTETMNDWIENFSLNHILKVAILSKHLVAMKPYPYQEGVVLFLRQSFSY